MHTSFSLLLALLIVLLSCKKENDTQADKPIPKIKESAIYDYGRLVTSFTYEYDEAGRLTRQVQSGGPLVTYTYSPGQVVINIINSNGTLSNTDTLQLNEKGQAYMERHGYQVNEFNTEGYLVKSIIHSLPPMTMKSIIENGNTVESAWQYDMYEAPSMLQRFQFLPHSVNTIGDQNKGIFFRGKQNRQLTRTKTTQDGQVLEYEYETDASNRVIKKTTKNYSVETFTYY